MLLIPTADKHDDVAVNQHLVPQCYMREWAYNPNQSSIWLYQKNAGVKESDVDDLKIQIGSKPIKKINAIDNYYDIKAGCYHMPEEALKEIFGPTMHLKVWIDSQELDTEEKRNAKFLRFDEWVVQDADGNPISTDEKEKLKIYFSEARFVFIEKEWDRQYENNWRTYIRNFEDKIKKTKCGIGCDSSSGINVSSLVTADMISEIIKLIIVFDIRGFGTDDYLNQQIDSILDVLPSELVDMELEPDDRMHPIEDTVRETFRHQYILRLCYDILKNNQMMGNLKTVWDNYKQNLIPCFCLTDMSNPFVTSERPVFFRKRDDGKIEQIFVALPTMLISLVRGDKGKFYISNLTPDEVAEYNRSIAQNNEYIISCSNTLDIHKLWT